MAWSWSPAGWKGAVSWNMGKALSLGESAAHVTVYAAWF